MDDDKGWGERLGVGGNANDWQASMAPAIIGSNGHGGGTSEGCSGLAEKKEQCEERKRGMRGVKV